MLAEGERGWDQCSLCHQIGDGARNRVGAHLTGVVDAQAAIVDGFRYSDALIAAAGEGLHWTEENLDAWPADPQSFVPGTEMAFPGLANEADRRAVIAHIARHGGTDQHPDRAR